MNLILKFSIVVSLASCTTPASAASGERLEEAEESVCSGGSLLQLAGGDFQSTLVRKTPASAVSSKGGNWLRPGSAGTNTAGDTPTLSPIGSGEQRPGSASIHAVSSESNDRPRLGSAGTDAAGDAPAVSSQGSDRLRHGNASTHAASSEGSNWPLQGGAATDAADGSKASDRPGHGSAGTDSAGGFSSLAASSARVSAAGKRTCQSVGCVNTTSLQLEVRATFLAFLSMHGSGYFAISSQSAVATVANQPDYESMHLLALEPFRFLGVLHIVLYNNVIGSLVDVGPFWARFASWGRYWFQFFFVLSGFVLYVSQKDSVDIADKKTFLSDRFYSTYPGYLIGCLLGLLGSPHPFQTAWDYASVGYVPGLLLMDSWFPPFGTTSPDDPGWLLCTMAAFYFFFPSWYRFVRASQVPKLLACIALLSCLPLPLICAIRGNVDADFARRHPLANWQKFFFGICLGRLLPEFKKAPDWLRKAGASLTLSALLLAFAVVQPPSAPRRQVLDLLLDGPVLLPFFGSVLVFVSIGEDRILSPRVLQSETLFWLGSISAQLYILHAPVYQMLHRILQSPSLKITFAAQLATAAAASSVFKYMSLTKGRSKALEWFAETYSA